MLSPKVQKSIYKIRNEIYKKKKLLALIQQKKYQHYYQHLPEVWKSVYKFRNEIYKKKMEISINLTKKDINVTTNIYQKSGSLSIK